MFVGHLYSEYPVRRVVDKLDIRLINRNSFVPSLMLVINIVLDSEYSYLTMRTYWKREALDYLLMLLINHGEHTINFLNSYNGER